MPYARATTEIGCDGVDPVCSAIAVLATAAAWWWLGRRGLVALAVIAGALGLLTVERNRVS